MLLWGNTGSILVIVDTGFKIHPTGVGVSLDVCGDNNIDYTMIFTFSFCVNAYIPSLYILIYTILPT